MSLDAASDFMFSVVSESNAEELSSFERLFIAETSRIVSHDGWHADLYLKCGCLKRARQHFEAHEHARKLGDIYWALAELDKAAACYSTPPGRAAHTSRFSKDWDRLIKLAFFRSDWPKVVRLVGEAEIQPSRPGRIVLGRSESAAGPYLKMLAAACVKGGGELEEAAAKVAPIAFGVSADAWQALVTSSRRLTGPQIKALQVRCRPLPASREPLELEEACAKGDTPRSRAIVSLLQEADTNVARARRDLKAFLKTGEEEHLQRMLATVLRSGLKSIGHSMLFRCLEMGQLDLSTVQYDRLIELYGCHPIMNKRYFGRLLELKFTHMIPLQGSEILTGIFQKLASLESAIEEVHGKNSRHVLDFRKLAACREWAVLRLDDWIRQDGCASLSRMLQAWRDGKVSAFKNPFGGRNDPPESPRDTQEWRALMDTVLSWLGQRWAKEVGKSPWTSENELFQLVKRKLKGIQVLQHAQPLWLSPQHLDIYVPEMSLAIEYMGQQHYAPVEFFGGEEGLRQTCERDKRKAALCLDMGVRLVHVRYDESLEDRAAEICAMPLRDHHGH